MRRRGNLMRSRAIFYDYPKTVSVRFPVKSPGNLWGSGIFFFGAQRSISHLLHSMGVAWHDLSRMQVLLPESDDCVFRRDDVDYIYVKSMPAG